MTNMNGHYNPVKVNSADLKTHLGRYLRSVEQESATWEICIRDRTVAYLIPASPSEVASANLPHSPLLALNRAGMKIEMATRFSRGDLAEPVVAGDGRQDVVTVDEMRRGREW